MISLAGISTKLVVATGFLFMVSNALSADFAIVVVRGRTADGLTHGTLYANGEMLGACFENDRKKIPKGKYNGVLRQSSGKNFVQGPGGKLGTSGDFLLEIAGVKDRTDILFHAGTKPEHSDGCILCGGAIQENSTWKAPEVLRKLRLLFFDGQDSPIMSPSKTITIEIK